LIILHGEARDDLRGKLIDSADVSETATSEGHRTRRKSNKKLGEQQRGNN
jgi:hypothetical protein